MKRHYSVPILLILLASLLLNGFFIFRNATTPNQPDIVTKVIDGDTVMLASGERVRLLGIDAPEEGRCFFEESRLELSELVLNKHILIKEEKRDAFGRRMGLVYQDGLLVNTLMIELGLALPDYTKNSLSEVFIKSYNQAKKEKLGVNSDTCKKSADSTPPNPRCTIKGNIDKATGNKFYHYPGCRQYSQIVLDLNTEEGYFCSEKEAQEAGFVKAQGCKE